MTTHKIPSQSGCKWIEQCIELCDPDPVYVDERGVRATFRNPDHLSIRKIHYDSCYNSLSGVKQADYIIGIPNVIDIIVELKGSDTNLTGERGADMQVESTLDAWRVNPLRAPQIAALIVFGRIEGKKRTPGRWPRARTIMQTLPKHFLRKKKILLLIHESGERQFRFIDFLKKRHAS